MTKENIWAKFCNENRTRTDDIVPKIRSEVHRTLIMSIWCGCPGFLRCQAFFNKTGKELGFFEGIVV